MDTYRELYQMGFRSYPPVLSESVPNDRCKLFWDEYKRLINSPLSLLLKRVPCYAIMRQYIYEERCDLHLPPFKPSFYAMMVMPSNTVKEVFLTDMIKKDTKWKEKIVHSILWNDPEWFDCFPVEIEIKDVTQHQNLEVQVCLFLNNFRWRLVLDHNNHIISFSKLTTRLSSGCEYNHAWEAIKPISSLTENPKIGKERNYSPSNKILKSIESLLN